MRNSTLTSILVLGFGAALVAFAHPGAGQAAPPKRDLKCGEFVTNVVGTWQSQNIGMGLSGTVTFKNDGTYTIDSGTYNAGGTWWGATAGTYEILDSGAAIAFRYANWNASVPSLPISRIAIVQCGSANRFSHFVMGHTHDYETLTKQ